MDPPNASAYGINTRWPGVFERDGDGQGVATKNVRRRSFAEPTSSRSRRSTTQRDPEPTSPVQSSGYILRRGVRHMVTPCVVWLDQPAPEADPTASSNARRRCSTNRTERAILRRCWPRSPTNNLEGPGVAKPRRAAHEHWLALSVRPTVRPWGSRFAIAVVAVFESCSRWRDAVVPRWMARAA